MLRIAATLCFFFSYLAAAQAAVTFTGNVSPDDPNSWTAETSGSVGVEGNGAVTIDGGAMLQASGLTIARGTREAGNVGQFSIDGAGSGITVQGRILLAAHPHFSLVKKTLPGNGHCS